MGLVALARPERVVATFGTRSLTRDGRNEVRAVYGGFGVAVGVLLLVSVGLPAIQAGVWLAVAVALLGMACGRLASLVIDGAPGPQPWLFLVVELFLAALLTIPLVTSGGA
jgi:hypothetical protein